MPYFETGTEVPFTAGDKVNLLTVALQGQNIGIVGLLRVPGVIDAPATSMLNNFTQQNLTDIAAFVSANCSNPVKFMKMSWNLSGSTITDLVLGLVVTIDAVPNNGQDLINAVMVQGPLQYLLDQIPSLGYDAYIIGSPPVGTYHQTITVTAESGNTVPLSTIMSDYGSEQSAIDSWRNKIIAGVQAQYTSRLAEQGITATVISATVLNMQLIKDNDNCKLAITLEIVADTNKPINDVTLGRSLIAPIIIAIIIIAIIASIAAAAIVADDILTKMVTKTVTVTEKTYGWIVDPVTGEKTWGIVNETTRTETGPDYGGILTVAVASVVVVGGIYAISKLFGERKQKQQ
jgi:hypothetical protein